MSINWVGLRCVIVVFPDHTHLLFDIFVIYTLYMQTVKALVGLHR